MSQLSKPSITKIPIAVFYFTIIFFSPFLLHAQGYFYQTDLQIGETLVYKQHEYNFTTQTWNPWFYLMYEITSIEDSPVKLEKETIIRAVQWVSNDNIHWKQLPFFTSTLDLSQDNELSEIGIISRLQEVPIHRFSGFQKENFVIQSDIKIGDMISSIETKINASLDDEDWLELEAINEGYGLKIVVSECGCSVEGGINKRIRNLTYSTRGILNNYYFSERVDYGADAETNQRQFELFLVQEFNFDGVVFENLSSNWNEVDNSSLLKSNVTQYYGVPFAFAVVLLIFWRRRQK